MDETTITFLYTNWRGETDTHVVTPSYITWLDVPDYGYEQGWFLFGYDHGRGATRQFSLDPCHMRPAMRTVNGEQVRIPVSEQGDNILLRGMLT